MSSSGWTGLKGSSLDFTQCGEYPDGSITPLSMTASGNFVLCNGFPSQITLTAVGGVPPFQWSVTAATWGTITPQGGPAYRTGIFEAGLPCPGNKTAIATVTDERGVSVSRNIDVQGVEAINPKINLTISTNVFDYNIRNAAISAGWNGTDVVDITLTIAGGVFVRASSTDTYALDSGAPWPTGSSLIIINNGFIMGKGGNGGVGGGLGIYATHGGHGGTALNIQRNTTVDNTNGFILGGGGGGGGGGGAYATCNCGKGGCDEGSAQGGGGGGGAGGGLDGGSGAAPGSTVLTSGAGGAGGGSSLSTCNTVSGAGGQAGDWGGSAAQGNAGNLASAEDPNLKTPGAGGQGGKAVNRNTSIITFIGGNNSTQVRGAIV